MPAAYIVPQETVAALPASVDWHYAGIVEAWVTEIGLDAAA
jgi:hypothetical protein